MRAAQDTNILYHCLINLPSKVWKAKVSVWNSQYKVNIQPSGNLLLKYIIREIHINANSTMKSIRTQISSLDVYIGTIGSDISKFNVHAKLLLERISAIGETRNYLLTKILRGTKLHQIQFLSSILRESKRTMRMGRT